MAKRNEEQLIVTTIDLAPPNGAAYWLEDDMFSVSEDGTYYPAFSVQEVAKAFFGQHADWLRWRMRPDKPSRTKCRACKATGEVPGSKAGATKKCPECKGAGEIVRGPRNPHGYFLDDNGKPMQFKRLPSNSEDPNKNTGRYFTLADIERMAHALARQQIIDGYRLAHIIVMVRSCARMYGVNAGRSLILEETEEQVEES